MFTVVVLSAVIILADIIVLNVVGKLASGWWPVAFLVGLLLVPLVGAVCLVALTARRPRAAKASSVPGPRGGPTNRDIGRSDAMEPDRDLAARTPS